ncbi:MAG: hypothetical protein GEU73_10600 [Chloroflexi bacterium]|nr:hypothetical protein [Chloroflexota bacterium]
MGIAVRRPEIRNVIDRPKRRRAELTVDDRRAPLEWVTRVDARTELTSLSAYRVSVSCEPDSLAR